MSQHKKERIRLIVDVDIYFDVYSDAHTNSARSRKNAIATAKQNVCAVSTLWEAVPVRARLVKRKAEDRVRVTAVQIKEGKRAGRFTPRLWQHGKLVHESCCHFLSKKSAIKHGKTIVQFA